jgi:hypothetical protein
VLTIIIKEPAYPRFLRVHAHLTKDQWETLAKSSLPILSNYVDNNSAPTIASNLLEANAVLSWHASCQRAKRFKPLLCATIGYIPTC